MPCFPGYRYCGPRCNGPGRPVNKIDALCMDHDSCYLWVPITPRYLLDYVDKEIADIDF